MVEIWKRAKDLQPGDHFDYWGRTVVAEEVYCSDSGVNVRASYGWIGGWKNPDAPVRLLRRPRPKGRTKKAMVDSIVVFANLALALRKTRLTASFNKAVSDLREAIEVYELGKPLKK